MPGNYHSIPVSYTHLNHDMGYNVLLPDLYGPGESEGYHIQMGWKDRWDVIRWSEIANEIFKVKSEEQRVKKDVYKRQGHRWSEEKGSSNLPAA